VSASAAEIQESHSQLLGAWSVFARKSRAGEVLELPEVTLATSNVGWPMLNMVVPRAPLTTEAELDSAVTAASRYFEPKGLGWMFGVSEDWLGPPLRVRAGELFAARGLKLVMEPMAMVAERLEAPRRPLPPLEVRRIKDSAGSRHLGDMNTLSYEAPQALGHEAFDVPGFFEGDCQGYVGYVDGQPVCSTATLRVDGLTYVAMVATHPGHRQRGYAEVVLRHALEESRREWGHERTVLHATTMGYPVYLRMGYRPTAKVLFLMKEAPPAR
jgi:GNAT superfamily N-acetyltransferase